MIKNSVQPYKNLYICNSKERLYIKYIQEIVSS